MKRFVLILAVITGLFLSLPLAAQDDVSLTAAGSDVDVTSNSQAYQSYLAAPTEGGPYPGIVLIHSFNGLEQGYRDMVDAFAARGFVVLAIGWQTFERSPSDAVVSQLVTDGIAFLKARPDVNSDKLGLTGFCAGGRYTMLFLPQLKDFQAGVAWYGFPYRGDTAPASLVGDLDAPMLVIHGTEDEPSPIADIYKYAGDLAAADKSFELKVYSDEPHGFMIQEGQLRQDEVAASAFNEMVSFFERKLNDEA